MRKASRGLHPALFRADQTEKPDVRSEGSSTAQTVLAGLTARTIVFAAIVSALAVAGCGGTAGIFNSAFLNTITGGEVPLTPGPGAAFVFVRCKNETDLPVEFILTIQRDSLVLDAQGNFQVDEDGEFVITPERETVRLTTLPNGQARELGTLFPCGQSPVTHVGLGKDLLPSDAAVFVGGQGVGGQVGFGVPAGALAPLQLSAGNFNCGDTIIFRAFRATGVAGGVALETFLLPGSEQPSVFRGPSTFVNLEQFFESELRGNEP